MKSQTWKVSRCALVAARILAALLLVATAVIAQPAPEPLAPAIRGVLKDFVMPDCTIYPGTDHKVTVYVPAEYKGSPPACVYVQLDGLKDGANHTERQMKFITTIDDLIAAKQMPVTIGVFVSPGGLPSPVPGTIGFSNRDLEYNSVNDTYARFVVEDLLPFVEKNAGVRLSTNANDRAIGGQSSGGIGAFNAAWQRPDLFSRVYCCSGTFAAFRGANELPTLIRKTEAKPIRAFLTVGDHDMDNYAGDWTDLNAEMETALHFAGYEFKYVHLHGGHCIGYPESFPDAMRFVWQGWPAPVVAGASGPRVQDILIPGEPWHLVADGFAGARSPVCDAKGQVLFVDTAKNKIMQIGLDGKIAELPGDAGQAEGLAVGTAGEIYTVSTRTGQVMVRDASGMATVLAEGVPGRYAYARSNGLYVTGPGDGPTGKVWFVTKDKKTVIDEGIPEPSGIALRPDLAFLDVADESSHWLDTFQAKPDGTLAHRERVFWLHVCDSDDNAGPASICYDREGHLYVATRMGVQICLWDGSTQVILPLPDRGAVSGLAIGGITMDTLYVYSQGKIWQRKVRGHAFGPFSPPTKMKPGKL